jgi:hypothetical protein
MRGLELWEWRIKVVRAPQEDERLAQFRSVIEAVLAKHRPTHIAVKLLPECKVSPLLGRIFDLLRDLASEHGITIKEYPLDTLKRNLVQGKLKSKRQMANELASMYPTLHPVLANLTKTKTYYHIRVFEAVAAARVCAQALPSSQASVFENHQSR